MKNSHLMRDNSRCSNLSYNSTNEKVLNAINNIFTLNEKSFYTHFKQNKIAEGNSSTTQNHGDFDSFADLIKEYLPNNLPSLRNICSRIAQKLGFNIYSKGVNYLIEAILYVYENNIDNPKINILYQIIGKRHAISASSVKSCINYSITATLPSIRQNRSMMFRIFSEYDDRVPNSKYLIILAVYELRRHFKPEGYDQKRIEKILYSI